MKDEIQLTDRERAVFADLDFMPLKAKVWEKMERLLAQLREALNLHLQTSPQHFAEAGIGMEGKISRGENYQTYAYRVLDYPAVFEKDDLFVFRTVILWGRPMGFHLILSGRYKTQYEPLFLAAAPRLPEKFLLSAQSHPWIWEPEPEKQLPIDRTSGEMLKKILSERDFLKLSVYLPLEAYAEIPSFGLNTWQQIEKILFGEK
ncbi:MAG: hypothetical protein SF052_14075 [Bacteroidia bacterium]|nr:hypothetical protein [Bacteroidia bacterium]